MRSAIEALMEEHRLFERFLGAWDSWADSVESRDEASNRESLGYFLSFVRELADQIHHGKEEDVLFVTLAEHGSPTEDGPIAIMLYEHTQGRELVSAIDAIGKLEKPWTHGDRETLVELIGQFDELLRQHIHKEDEILYPMATAQIPPGTMDDVSARCDERDRARAEDRARLEALGEKLIATYA